MNDKIPAALASIKRYDCYYRDEYGSPVKVPYAESVNGYWVKWQDIAAFATLPPPADGAVGFRVRLSKSDKWGVWQMGASPTASELAMFPIIQYAYAAPPADSAMVGVLREYEATLTDLIAWNRVPEKLDYYVNKREEIRTLLAGRK